MADINYILLLRGYDEFKQEEDSDGHGHYDVTAVWSVAVHSERLRDVAVEVDRGSGLCSSRRASTERACNKDTGAARIKDATKRVELCGGGP